MPDSYRNLDLRLFDHRALPGGDETFRVQVVASLVGEQREAETVTMPASLRARCAQLERRELDWPQMKSLGQAVAALLLPPEARTFYSGSLAHLGLQERLRLRVLCEAVELDAVPWEISYLVHDFEDASSEMGLRGFIVLDSRQSLVRREICRRPASPTERVSDRRRLLAVMCEPASLRNPASPLEVDKELSNLRATLDAGTNIDLVHCTPATREAIAKALLQEGGADIFHFAGHGVFKRLPDGGSRAYLMLQREDGSSDEWPVDRLALRLANKGIQLAMLGACRSAQSDGHNSWAGIAPSLARLGIPMVIGMQYTVYDVSAVEFSRRLYGAWSQAGTIDEAMVEARLAITDLPDDTGRDFATPVLYLHESSNLTLQVRAPAAPQPVAPIPVIDARQPENAGELAPMVELLAELYDYKRVHDALHSIRTQPLNVILLRRDDFPGGTTLREFSSYAREFRKRLQDLNRIAAEGRCEAALMADVTNEFSEALAHFEQALQQQSQDALENAIFSFGTLLNTQPVRVDTWMSALAQRFELERMVALLQSLPLNPAATATAVGELRSLGEQLRRRAILHSNCQSIDSRLAVIRTSKESDRFRTIRGQAKALAGLLEKVLPEWSAVQVNALRQCGQELATGVAANDEQRTWQAFESLCEEFDYAFYTIDADFKELCGQLKQRAESQLPQRRANG